MKTMTHTDKQRRAWHAGGRETPTKLKRGKLYGRAVPLPANRGGGGQKSTRAHA